MPRHSARKHMFRPWVFATVCMFCRCSADVLQNWLSFAIMLINTTTSLPALWAWNCPIPQHVWWHVCNGHVTCDTVHPTMPQLRDQLHDVSTAAWQTPVSRRTCSMTDNSQSWSIAVHCLDPLVASCSNLQLDTFLQLCHWLLYPERRESRSRVAGPTLLHQLAHVP